MKTAIRFLVAGALVWASSPTFGEPAAIPPSDPAYAKAEAAFQTFAADWMKKMSAAEAHERQQAKGGAYRGYGDDFKIELKPTGSAAAPFVGLLRYQEHQCAAGSGPTCRVVSTTAVTEIFRFQGGRWVY